MLLTFIVLLARLVSPVIETLTCTTYVLSFDNLSVIGADPTVPLESTSKTCALAGTIVAPDGKLTVEIEAATLEGESPSTRLPTFVTFKFSDAFESGLACAVP